MKGREATMTATSKTVLDDIRHLTVIVLALDVKRHLNILFNLPGTAY